MNPGDHEEFLCRIAKSLYYGDTSSFDSVSLPLTELAAELYNEVKKENTLNRLHTQEVAEINKNACVSTCSLVLAILYLEKIKTKNPEYVEKVTSSELFLVSLLIASKFLNDDCEEDSITNSEWAVCSGLPLKTVNRIEKEFLDAIKWEVHISEQQFWSRLLSMERYLANQEGKRRGWYSYTEFNVLITVHELQIIKELLKYSALCATCYASTVFSLIGAALVAIRVKHFLLNCILYILVNRTMTDEQPCNSTFVTIGTNSSLDAQQNEVLNILHSDISTSGNNDEKICDGSLFECFNANITSELLSFKVKNPSTLYMKLLKYVAVDKSNIANKYSLFHSRQGWPNF